MNHRTVESFWKCFDALPQDIQQLARDNFDLLKANPQHPSLHFKKIDKLWSARVGIHYRALAAHVTDDVVWFWIGTYAEYDAILKRR